MEMQQQIIDQIAQRVGIPADKAKMAADIVIGYLKEHLPGPVASQLGQAMSGEAAGTGNVVSKATEKLGEMFKH